MKTETAQYLLFHHIEYIQAFFYRIEPIFSVTQDKKLAQDFKLCFSELQVIVKEAQKTWEERKVIPIRQHNIYGQKIK